MSRGGVTLIEVLVALVIVAIALPPLLTTQLTIRRMDASQTERSQSTHLTGAVLETIHYRMYNGYRTDPNNPETLIDARGFKLNDTRTARVAAQRTDSALRFFAGLAERSTGVVATAGHARSGFFPPPATAHDGTWLERYRLDVSTFLKTDDAPLPPRISKNWDEPAIDMALVTVALTWDDAVRGQPTTRTVQTRFTRYLYDEDFTHSMVGPQVAW